MSHERRAGHKDRKLEAKSEWCNKANIAYAFYSCCANAENYSAEDCYIFYKGSLKTFKRVSKTKVFGSFSLYKTAERLCKKN